jgi:hypothetical protein
MSTVEKTRILTTKEALLAAPLPKKTKSYSPVPHKIVIQNCLEQLDKANIKVLHELYTSAREGRQANGIYHLAGGDEQMNLRLQWQNSYDKSLPLAAAFGSQVIVCGNGLIMGDMGRFKRKHTGDVVKEFVESVKIFIGDAEETFKKMTRDRDRMKEITMTKRTSAELVGRMFLEDEVITATQLGIIKRELQAPTFNYGTDKELLKAGGTLWDTYNAVTVSLKEAHPQFNMDQHVNLHNKVTRKYYEKEFA